MFLDTIEDQTMKRASYYADPLLAELPLMEGLAYQNHAGKPSLADRMTGLELYTLLKEGDVAIFSVDVGSTPSADNEKERNHAALQDLPTPFGAEFTGHTQTPYFDADGAVWWDAPIKATCADQEITLQPETVFLEVGYMRGAKMQMSVIANVMCLARWPYGSTKVTVFVPKAFY